MSGRPKVVVDTNVLVSAILFEGGNEAEILNRIQNAELYLYVSPELYAEFVEVISRPKFQLSEAEVSAACELILGQAKFVQPTGRVQTKVRDIDDLMVLECAREAKATYIITGDKDLLTLREFGKASIMTPSKFARKIRHGHY